MKEAKANQAIELTIFERQGSGIPLDKTVATWICNFLCFFEHFGRVIDAHDIDVHSSKILQHTSRPNRNI